MYFNGTIAVGPEISVDEASELLRAGNRVILLDVRSEGEMCLGHVRGARLIPLGNLEEEVSVLSPEADVSRNRSADDRQILYLQSPHVDQHDH